MNPSQPILSHEYFMAKALNMAFMAYDLGEIPVGAIVVSDGKIIGKGYNQTEQLNDVTAHAEVIAISAASQYLGAKYLKKCTIYVTLEPCVMCAGAIFWSQIDQVVYGASDTKRGFAQYSPSLVHPKAEIISGVLKKDCESLLQKFFDELRT